MDVKISEFATLVGGISANSLVPIIQDNSNYIVSVSSLNTPPTSKEVLDALEGETVTVDYILTTDQSENTIPNYAFSRKGEIPYFGNTPIGSGEMVKFGRNSIVSTGVETRALLCSVPIDAASMSDGTSLHVDMKVNISLNSPSIDGWMILFALDNSVDYDGVVILFGDYTSTRIDVMGYLNLQASGGGVVLTGSNTSGLIVGNLGTANPTDVLHGKVLVGSVDILDNSISNSPVGVANNLSIYLVAYSAIAGRSALADCHARVSIEIL